MRIGKSRGSYLPILTKIVSMTTGPILELGVGFCSTPYLHWACYHTKRLLISYENNPEYYRFAESWKDTFHEIHCITDWATIILDELWAVAFVDHSPGWRRAEETKRLLHADYVVIHDTENRSDGSYKLSTIRHLFKYRYKYRDAYPHTSVWSNKYNFEGL